MGNASHHTYVTDESGSTAVSESSAEELDAMAKTAAFKALWEMSG